MRAAFAEWQDYAIAALLAAATAFIALRIAGVPLIQITDMIPVDFIAPQLPQPDPAWRVTAGSSNILAIPGHQVAYWGRMDRGYGEHVTRHAVKPIAIVYHYTADVPMNRVVEYQHNGDRKRGGSYGYHIYVDKWGRVIQGAPLSKRTNHIKPAGHKQRRLVGVRLNSSNALGIAFVGGCKLAPTSSLARMECVREEITAAQLQAGLAAGRAILARYDIPCGAVYGHGDLQHDRASFEGALATAALRAECARHE